MVGAIEWAWSRYAGCFSAPDVPQEVLGTDWMAQLDLGDKMF